MRYYPYVPPDVSLTGGRKAALGVGTLSVSPIVNLCIVWILFFNGGEREKGREREAEGER